METSAEEMKEKNIAAMGKALGEQYSELWQEVADVYGKWGEYVVLFGSKPSRIDLLNRAARSYFWVLQNTLWEDLLLHVARMMDTRREALSFHKLYIYHPATNAKYKDAYKVAEAKTAFCRDWRNRRIAHRNAELSLGRATPLTEGSRADLSSALQSLVDLLNIVSHHYLQTTSAFHYDHAIEGAEQLLYVLDDGLKVEEERKARLEAGTGSISDWQRKDI